MPNGTGKVLRGNSAGALAGNESHFICHLQELPDNLRGRHSQKTAPMLLNDDWHWKTARGEEHNPFAE